MLIAATLVLLEITLFIAFCYLSVTISRFFLMITEPGQMFEGWQKVLDYLHEKRTTGGFAWELLYKALGGCETCNAMWISIVLYPVYLWAGSAAGFAGMALNDTFVLIALWLIAPAVTLDILRIENK